MNIGYRRYSGKAFLDAEKVTSKRGAWLEKRLALIDFLKKRNTVEIIENGTDYSKFDKILVEFGSLNTMFYADDIKFSEEILASGKAIFLLDDPDLMPKYLLENPTIPIFVNADAEKCSKYWKRGNFESFPVYGLQTFKVPHLENNGKVVYYGGTSGGREDKLLKLSVLVPELVVVGAKKDYKFIIPKEPPEQTERADFYSSFMACLNLRDAKHKKTGWNTGREFHAILAGCPVVQEEGAMFQMIKDLKNENHRMGVIKAQQASIIWAGNYCDKILKKYGM